MVTTGASPVLIRDYRTGFNIFNPKQAANALLEQISVRVEDWFGRMADDAAPIKESGEIDHLVYRRFQVDIPHHQTSDFRLSLDIKLASRGGPVSVSVQSSLLETGGAVSHADIIAGPPSLVIELLNAYECRRGPDRISATPTIITAETAAEFAEQRILASERRLPIIAISQDWRGHSPVDPKRLQAALAGQAEVATCDSPAADALRAIVGFQLACFNGAIRIYHPGCARGDRRERYNFWMPDAARRLNSLPTGKLVREFAQFLPEPSDSGEYESVRNLARQQRIAEQTAEARAIPLRRRINSLEGQIESLRQQLQEGGQDTTASAAEIHGLHRQLSARDAELDSLRHELEQAVHLGSQNRLEIVRLNQQQTERDERIESLRQQLEAAAAQADAAESEAARLHTRLQDKDNLIKSMRRDLDAAALREIEVEKEITSLNAHIQESDNQIESLRQQLDAESQSAGVSREAVALLKAELWERENELAILRSQHNDALSLKQENANVIAALSEGLKTRDADIVNLRLLLEGVQHGLADTAGIIAELNRELQEREDDAKAIGALLEQTRQRADAAENATAELRRELALRPSELDGISRVIRESRDNVAEARTQVAAANAYIAQLRQEIEILNDEIEALIDKNYELEKEVSRQKTAYLELENRFAEQDNEISALKFRLRADHIAEAAETETDGCEPRPGYDSVENAVILADQGFGNLQFLDSVFDSAENYPFERPDEVYRAFELLQEIADIRAKGPLGKPVEAWLKERQYEYSPRESRATMQEFGAHRRFWDGQRHIEMQEHIKIGKGTSNKQRYIRIYFCWDADNGRYLIGHAGEHLPIASD